MLEPKELTLTDMNGVAKTFVISKMPYYPAREVISQFIPTGSPKIGDYRENEKLSQIMFRYVSIVLPEGQKLALTTPTLVENHVDFKTGILLEKAMLEYNAGFFDYGAISNSLSGFAQTAQVWITKILTDSQARSSAKEKQASTNSKRSTRSKMRS